MADMLVWARRDPRALLNGWVDPKGWDNHKMKEYSTYVSKPNVFRLKMDPAIISRLRKRLIPGENVLIPIIAPAG